ncbi:hypothetical protein [Acinetobacter ursingii]|uniref:hypothetical protein n=1 Tax=Acinetobacter ursingii TaxID=108980 RepID=UPI0012506F00|nr:hypothetical protein [Acinetobacter ursingii]
MNAHKFVAEHGVEQAKSILEKAPETATHFTEALGGHYAKEVMLKMRPQWAWFNTINKEWYYDFAAKEHIELAELKQVVESLDTIDRLFGLDQAKQTMVIAKEIGYSSDYEQIKQAIEDYKHVQAYKNGDA